MSNPPIVQDGFAFRLPEAPQRFRANCSGEWGCFVHGDTKGMKNSQAEKAGLTKGNFLEIALCHIDPGKVLTFEPNYICEPFTEIWGIPVAGEIKNDYHAKASTLITFLVHRRSKDKMSGEFDTFGKDAFNAWVEGGMKGDPNQFALEKAAEAYFSHIFRFEFVPEQSKAGLTYHWLKMTYRKPDPKNPIEEAALKVSRQIFESQNQGILMCRDPRIEENHLKSMETLGALSLAGDAPNATPALAASAK